MHANINDQYYSNTATLGEQSCKPADAGRKNKQPFSENRDRGAAGNVQHGVYHETRIVCRNNGRPHSGMDEKAERFKSGNLNR